MDGKTVEQAAEAKPSDSNPNTNEKKDNRRSQKEQTSADKRQKKEEAKRKRIERERKKLAISQQTSSRAGTRSQITGVEDTKVVQNNETEVEGKKLSTPKMEFMGHISDDHETSEDREGMKNDPKADENQKMMDIETPAKKPTDAVNFNTPGDSTQAPSEAAESVNESDIKEEMDQRELLDLFDEHPDQVHFPVISQIIKQDDGSKIQKGLHVFVQDVELITFGRVAEVSDVTFLFKNENEEKGVSARALQVRWDGQLLDISALNDKFPIHYAPYQGTGHRLGLMQTVHLQDGDRIIINKIELKVSNIQLYRDEMINIKKREEFRERLTMLVEKEETKFGTIARRMHELAEEVTEATSLHELIDIEKKLKAHVNQGYPIPEGHKIIRLEDDRSGQDRMYQMRGRSGTRIDAHGPTATKTHDERQKDDGSKRSREMMEATSIGMIYTWRGGITGNGTIRMLDGEEIFVTANSFKLPITSVPPMGTGVRVGIIATSNRRTALSSGRRIL